MTANRTSGAQASLDAGDDRFGRRPLGSRREAGDDLPVSDELPIDVDADVMMPK